MLGGLLKGFVDVEQMTSDTITKAIGRLSQKEGLKPTEIFIMINTSNDETCEPSYYMYKAVNGKPPSFIRKLKLSEILETDE